VFLKRKKFRATDPDANTRCVPYLCVAAAALWLLAAHCGHAAETREALAGRLLPAPHELTVHGSGGATVDGSRVLLCGFPEDGAVAWDPVAVLAPITNGGRAIVRRSVPAAASSRWWCALVPEADADQLPSAEERALDSRLGAESYALRTTAGPNGWRGVVVAGGPRGLLYGLQTLAQLVTGAAGDMPLVSITDWPDVAGIRELHVHGFDKGYGAGDFKSLAAFTRDLPEIMPFVAAARFNVFRLSLDAGWINAADRWLPGADIDATMRQVSDVCHRHGVDLLVEVRLEGQRETSAEPDTYPLNPLSEWPVYERALRRALGWRPDIIDFSLNDLHPIAYPDVIEKYGGDGRYSGKLMAELLHQVRAVLDEVRPQTRLHHLPRFYGDVLWKRHPNAMPELWENAPKGTVMYMTSSVLHPVAAEMRRRYDAQFALWTNYTSNHAKELKVILTCAPPGPSASETPQIAHLLQISPATQRHALINLGYPIAPQHAVVLTAGEQLWNTRDWETWTSLDKAARRVWGDAPGALVVRYARLLDAEMMMATRGIQVAALLGGAKRVAEDEGTGGVVATAAAQWSVYRQRAVNAAEVAQQLAAAVESPALKQTAQILFWNARRVALDCEAGELVTAGRASGRLDVVALEHVLDQHERVIREHTPVEPNDPKSAEVVMRGIRRIREELNKRRPRE
jgi:hypothetical protein